METSKITIRKWLVNNSYNDIAGLINEVMDEWQKLGRRTRRNWWDIFSGDIKGNSRVISGRKFPVLKSAQIRQGKQVTNNALFRNLDEKPPSIRQTKRWNKDNSI